MVKYILAVSFVASFVVSACSGAPGEVCKSDSSALAKCGAGVWQACERDNAQGACTALAYVASDGKRFACSSCTDCGSAAIAVIAYCGIGGAGDDGGGVPGDDAATLPAADAAQADAAMVDAALPPVDASAPDTAKADAGPAVNGAACGTSAGCASNCCDAKDDTCKPWAMGASCLCHADAECLPLTPSICGGDGGGGVGANCGIDIAGGRKACGTCG